MALSAAFRERLEAMEHTRNQRLSLLQAEKELQASKSMVLSSKLANIRSMEQRCSLLDQKIASQSFKISRLKSEIDRLDSKYETDSQQLRVLKIEAEELEELEKEKEKFYESKSLEMSEFKQKDERFASECRNGVQQLRKAMNEVQESFDKFQGDHGSWSDSEIGAAEMRKSQLLAAKEELDRNLAFNYQMRAQLQMELQTFLAIHNHPKSI